MGLQDGQLFDPQEPGTQKDAEAASAADPPRRRGCAAAALTKTSGGRGALPGSGLLGLCAKWRKRALKPALLLAA